MQSILQEESETVTNIESYLAAMRQMNELAVATAEERFSSLRRPSHQQQLSSHEHPPPPSPPANATAASTANPATASPKGKGKGKGIATTVATTVVDAGEFADSTRGDARRLCAGGADGRGCVERE